MKKINLSVRKLIACTLCIAIVAATGGCSGGPGSAQEPEKAPASQAAAQEASQAASQAPASQAGKDAGYAKQAFADVEPLAETVELNLGSLSSSTHGFTNYLIEKLGGYEKANLDANIIVFGNGPILVEAMASGDCDAGLYGLGGTLAGTIGQGFVNLGAGSRDYHALQFFSPNDSDIVAAGQVTPDVPGLYGTADTWRGKEIFLPLGTTLHFMLSRGLEKLGLTTDDVTLTHMEVPNVNTALRAGQCEVGGVWTNYPYGDLNDTCTPVMKASDVGVTLVTCFAATPKALADEKKAEGIKKWMELYFKAVDWMYASDENRAQAVDWFIEWNEDNGIASVKEEIEAHCEYQRCYTLEENYNMIHETSANGTYSKLVEFNVEPLRFFVEQGNYKPEDIDTFLQPQYFDGSIVEELYGK